MFKYNVELRTYDEYILNVFKTKWFLDICLVGLNHISWFN